MNPQQQQQQQQQRRVVVPIGRFGANNGPSMLTTTSPPPQGIMQQQQPPIQLQQPQPQHQLNPMFAGVGNPSTPPPPSMNPNSANTPPLGPNPNMGGPSYNAPADILGILGANNKGKDIARSIMMMIIENSKQIGNT